MSSQGCMVYFNIQFKIIHQIKLTQESSHSSCIVVVLMLCRFCWFWLNEEHSFEALLSRIIFCSMQETSEMLLLSFHICVQQTHIAFTTSPENIILTTQRDGCIQRIFYLSCSVCKYMEIRVCRSTVHIAWVRKQISCSPQ